MCIRDRHGGPKFTADGRYVFFGSRDGWVTKFDLYALRVVAEARAGINARNIALSKDGKHIAVANYLPNTLVIAMGEFGRTPALGTQGSTDGRNHWPFVMSMCLAGGGFRHGQVIGASSRDGGETVSYTHLDVYKRQGSQSSPQ